MTVCQERDWRLRCRRSDQWCGAALVMEVWPSGIALQGEVSNYCELLR